MCGACLHRGVQPDRRDRVLGSIAISAAEKIQIIWNFLAQKHFLAQLPWGPKQCYCPWCGTITEQSAVGHQPTGTVPNGESAACLGVPSARGGREKAGKGEGFKESLCCQVLQLQMFGKTFPKGLEQGANSKNQSFYYCD